MLDSKKIATRPQSSFSDTMKHSIAMGAGMSIGQRLINGAMCMLEQGSPSPPKVDTESLENRIKRCEPFKTDMDNCMKYNTVETPCYEELRGYMQCINTPPIYTKKNTQPQ